MPIAVITGASGLLGGNLAAELRTRRVDPLDLYLATQKVAQSVPSNADIQRELESSRKSALLYYFKLAETYFDAESFDAAYDAYEAGIVFGLIYARLVTFAEWMPPYP